MPGSAQNPWSTELKARKKSVPRKRSVTANGKKGNENTDDVCKLSKFQTEDNADDKSNELSACDKAEDDKLKASICRRNENTDDDVKVDINNDRSKLNVRPLLSSVTISENDSDNNSDCNPLMKTATSPLSCDPFMSSNSSPCPCPSKLNSMSSPTGDDKKSHMSDNPSRTEKFETTSDPTKQQLSSRNMVNSKAPIKTGEKDKNSLVTKKRNVSDEKKKGNKIPKDEEVKNVMSSEHKGNNANKVNFKDEIKDSAISSRPKTNDVQDQGYKKVNLEDLDSKKIYQEARGKLKPTYDRQTSFNRKPLSGLSDGKSDIDGDDNENPVERLIRQDSIETKVNPAAEAKKREFLLLNYPADVRKNLKGLSSASFEKDDTIKLTSVIKDGSNNKKVNTLCKEKDDFTVSTGNKKLDDDEISRQKTTIKTRKDSVKKGSKCYSAFVFIFRLRLP